MPPFLKARDHNASLQVVCAACWRKNKTTCTVSDKLADLIRKHVYNDFNTRNSYHPRVICDGCRKTLTDMEKVSYF